MKNDVDCAMNVFLDTEFTDLMKPCLISIGLVAEDSRELYVELPYQAEACSEFVRETVCPLLARDPDANCSIDQVGDRVIGWLESIRPYRGEIEILFDFQSDWDLLVNAMQYQIATWISPRLLRSSEVNALMLEDYWHRNPGETPHHALCDARALRHAFRKRSI